MISGAVAVDATSSFEFGAAGATAPGSLTIDSGQLLTLQGAATIAAKLVVNGNMTVYGGTIQGFGGTKGPSPASAPSPSAHLARQAR